jgi:hypothetical protein
MKVFGTIIVALGFVGATGFARPELPVMTLDMASGYVPIELSYSMECEVYQDRVVITDSRGGGDAQAISYGIELPDEVHFLLEQAKDGPFSEPVTPTDIPSKIARGNIIGVNDGVQTVDIFTQYSGYTKINESSAADALLEMLDQYCLPTPLPAQSEL